MLTNLRSANLLLIIAVLICIAGYIFPSLSMWWLLLPASAYLGLLIYGSATIQAGFFTKTYCSGDTSEKIIAISFDDGPHSLYTPQVLDILAEHKIPASFFIIGKNISGREDIIKRMHAEGHITGNHTWSHSFFIDLKTEAGFRAELKKTAEALHRITGSYPRYFRPPYGVTTPALAEAAEKLHLAVVGWSIRSLDTTSRPEEKISERVQSSMKPGSIILFHDTSLKTVSVLKQTLNFAEQNGFKIVSLEELLKIPAYA